MNLSLTSVLLGGSLLVSTLASATTASYQYCSTSGCRMGGSATVISSYAKTKYPVVLAHGMGGFTTIAGASEYFYGIGSDLSANGAKVFETQVASFDSSYIRGEQLLNQVKQIVAITGSPKVNLIGHSQGTIDSRYVAGVRPDLVASVTGVGGPNLGSPVADAIKSASQIPYLGPALTPVITGGIDAFFALLDESSGQRYSQSSLNGLNQLTTAGSAAYNAQFPAGMPQSTTPCASGQAVVNGIRFYSWGGTSHLTNVLDISDPLLLLTGALIPEANDGLVGQCSSHLGQVIRDDYPQNHLDEVNLVFGLVNAFATSPVTLFRQQANRLQLAGL